MTYSLDEFSKHGGLSHKNKSGWGIAYYHDRDAFVIKEPEPAFQSPWVRLIAQEELESTCVIAHVRLATVGDPSLHNTHPFRRALGGRVHIFAHNGTLQSAHRELEGQLKFYEPVGDTDSEIAFCVLMDQMRPLWKDRPGEEAPSADERMAVFVNFCHDMQRRGSANFLYSDGDMLFAHAHRRIYEEADGFSEPRPPGMSIRDCIACQMGPDYACEGLTVHGQDQRSILLASVPLDPYGWQPLPEGTALAIRNGELLYTESTL